MKYKREFSKRSSYLGDGLYYGGIGAGVGLSASAIRYLLRKYNDSVAPSLSYKQHEIKLTDDLLSSDIVDEEEQTEKAASNYAKIPFAVAASSLVGLPLGFYLGRDIFDRIEKSDADKELTEAEKTFSEALEENFRAKAASFSKQAGEAEDQGSWWDLIGYPAAALATVGIPLWWFSHKGAYKYHASGDKKGAELSALKDYVKMRQAQITGEAPVHASLTRRKDNSDSTENSFLNDLRNFFYDKDEPVESSNLNNTAAENKIIDLPRRVSPNMPVIKDPGYIEPISNINDPMIASSLTDQINKEIEEKAGFTPENKKEVENNQLPFLSKASADNSGILGYVGDTIRAGAEWGINQGPDSYASYIARGGLNLLGHNPNDTIKQKAPDMFRGAIGNAVSNLNWADGYYAASGLTNPNPKPKDPNEKPFFRGISDGFGKTIGDQVKQDVNSKIPSFAKFMGVKA